MESDFDDFCRVCRDRGSTDRPLFFPCMCTGSIRYIHQDCLMEWLRHSRKEFCEVCQHKFTFRPVYSPNMPPILPVSDLLGGAATNMMRWIQLVLHYALAMVSWLGLVPLSAYRVYSCLLSRDLSSLLEPPLNILSTEDIFVDILKGYLVIALTGITFISLVYLREQIAIHGGPAWMDLNDAPLALDPLPDQPPQPAAEPWRPPDPAEVEAPAVAGALPQAPRQDGPAELQELGRVFADVAAGIEMEADRIPLMEDLTLERFLGLDGDIKFLEHVFWVMSMNTTFTVIFAFLPHNVGRAARLFFSSYEVKVPAKFDHLASTALGYIIISTFLFLAHILCRLVRFTWGARILGNCYIILKVFLLFIFEVAVLPCLFGWWLDICSLPLVGMDLSSRKAMLMSNPVASVALHWLTGMVFLFYQVSFLYLTRDTLRPGLLWFFRRLQDRDFNSLLEMIHVSLLNHLSYYCMVMAFLGATVVVLVWIPIHIVTTWFPGFLPYSIFWMSQSPIGDLYFDLLLFNTILPGLMEHTTVKRLIQKGVRSWAQVAGNITGLSSFLLGNVPLSQEGETVWGRNGPQVINAANLYGEVHQEQVVVLVGPASMTVNIDFKPYKKPAWFRLRLLGLFTLIFVAVVAIGFLLITVPVSIGRFVLHNLMNTTSVHDLYTLFIGIHGVLLGSKLLASLHRLLPLDINRLAGHASYFLQQAGKVFVCGISFFVIIPFMMGLLFELTLIIPMRVPYNQTVIIYWWQQWALGVVQTKLLVGFIFLGPNWRLQQDMNQIIANGLWRTTTGFILHRVAVPMCAILFFAISVPFSLGFLTTCILNLSLEHQTCVTRNIFPLFYFVIATMLVVHFQIRQIRRFYEKIKNDKYLVGQVLVNVDQHHRSSLMR